MDKPQAEAALTVERFLTRRELAPGDVIDLDYPYKGAYYHIHGRVAGGDAVNVASRSDERVPCRRVAGTVTGSKKGSGLTPRRTWVARGR